MTISEWLRLARHHCKRQEGQTMTEYGVVLAVISIGALSALTAFSGAVQGTVVRAVGLLPK
jgi:Flp pilus assembly pilin Flp